MRRLDDRLLGGSPWLATTVTAALVLLVGAVAGGCALFLDGLGAGGRTLCGFLAAWGLVVGALGLRTGLAARRPA